MSDYIDITQYTTPDDEFDLRDVDPERRAEVALSEIRIAKRRYADTRPRTMTARDALSVLLFEVDFVLVCGGNVAQGVALSPDDLQRLALACARIETIAHEAGCAG